MHDFTPPIILYAQLKVYKLPLKIKLRALLKAWSPRVVLSCFLFSPFLFCSSFRTYNWSVGVLWDHLLAWASKTHSRRCLRWGTFSYSRGCLQPPWSEQVRVSRTLLVSHVNQSGHASVSPLCCPFANTILLRISLDPTGAGPRECEVTPFVILSLSCVLMFATWTASRQASLSFTIPEFAQTHVH